MKKKILKVSMNTSMQVNSKDNQQFTQLNKDSSDTQSLNCKLIVVSLFE